MNKITPLLILSLALFVSTANAEEPNGYIHGVLFKSEDGTPLKSGRLFSLEQPDQVSEFKNGVLVLPLSPGKHTLMLAQDGAVVSSLGEVEVQSGMVTEVIGTVAADGRVASFEMEAPQAPAPETAAVKVEATTPPSAIEGRVTNGETGEGIAEVRIFVRGVKGETVTDKGGNFRFELPQGTWDVSGLHPEYNTVTVKGIVVGETPAKAELVASPMGVTLADYVVSAPRIEGGSAALLDERKDSTTVDDVIGAEQMSKTGDSNAASALQRVTGITVVGGKYVYVRGLGERYSSTLMNGAMLPSPEPERRVIPLDMFPAATLDSVVIQKSYSPDMPGEFGGGVIMLRTKNYPEKPTLDISLSGGITTGTTFTQGWMSPSGPTDWLGVDGSFRDLPDDFVSATEDQKLVEEDFITPGFTLEEIESLGEMLPKQWGTQKSTIPPNFGLSLSAGNTFKFGHGIRFGVLASGLYDNDWESLEQEYKVYNMGADGMEVFNDYDFETTTNTIKTSGFLALGLELTEDHSIRSTTMVNRITDDMTRFYMGFNRDAGTDIRVSNQKWIERMLFTQQIIGEHRIEPLHELSLDWRYTYSRASRDEPLSRENRYDWEDKSLEGEESFWRLSNRPEGNNILISDLEDDTHDIGFDLEMPFRFGQDNEVRAGAGGAFVIRDRTVDTRRFSFNSKKSNSFPTDRGPLTYDPDDLFTDEFIGPFTYEGAEYRGLEVWEATQPTDNYTATQNITAGYGKVELDLPARVTVMGGLRIEHSHQQVDTFELFTAEPQVLTADLDTLDYLPAATVSWEFVKNMVIRGGYGRTVSRPEFRELSPAKFNDVTGGRELFGNADLNRCVIDNFDIRWDWFLNPGEVISFGGFLKLFDEPIETSIVPAAQPSSTWMNADSATNFGLEFELYKSFNWISPVLADFYFSGNASWIYSKVKLKQEGIQTSDERPLQGQSPFVINAQLGYDNAKVGFSGMILYNVFGKRITEVGASELPDMYEQSFHQLDLVLKQKLKHGFDLSFKVKNMLNDEVEYTQGDEVAVSYRKGVEFSLGAGWSM